MKFMSHTLTVPSVLGDKIAKCLQQTTLLETESQIVGAFANCEERLLASSCLSVCPPIRPSAYPSVRVEQLVSHWTNFHGICYLSIFSKIRKEYSNFSKI